MRLYKLRPSAASTWIHCHGQPRMLEGIPVEQDDEDVEVREEGTACHWAAHQLALGNAVAIDTIAPNGVPIDEEMLIAARTWIDETRSWGQDAPPSYEQPLHCAWIHDECGGVTDGCAYSPSKQTLYIGDLKYGFRFVDVRDNWQLICYFAGALAHYGLSDLHTWVEFVIVQPRSYHRDGPVRRWRVHASELRGQINQLRGAADAALGVSLTPVTLTVNKGCGRCAARFRCTAAQDAALDGVDSGYEATPHDLPFAAAEDELRRLQWARDALEARITGLEGQVSYHMRKGAISRHFELKAKAGREIWKEGEFERAQNMARLYGVELTKPPQPITPTQAKSKMPPFVVEQFSHRPHGALKLVPTDAVIWRRIFGKH